MNSFRSWSFLFVLLLMTGEVEAGITSINFTGPGGSGFADFSQGNHTVAIFDIDYNSFAYENIAVTVNAGGSYTLKAAPPDFYILNVSHQSWTTFTFASESGAVFSSASETTDPNSRPPADHFADISVTSNLVTYSGGPGVIWDPSNPNSNSLTFFPSFSFTTTSAGTYDFVSAPFLSSVPEPSSIILLGSGTLVGLGVVHRLRRRRHH